MRKCPKDFQLLLRMLAKKNYQNPHKALPSANINNNKEKNVNPISGRRRNVNENENKNVV